MKKAILFSAILLVAGAAVSCALVGKVACAIAGTSDMSDDARPYNTNDFAPWPPTK